MALVVGELTAYLTVDNDAYKRGVTEARGDLNKLATDAKRSGDQVGTSTERMVRDVSNSMTALTRDAQGKLRNSRGQFATEAEKIAAGMAPAFRKGGEKNGGLLAQGVRSGFIRNSPLIVAAVGGALAAGAPAVLTGATALMAGIGIVTAAQTVAVRSAWTDAWEWIRDGAIEAANPIEGVLIGLADRVSDRFDAMLPAIGRAFDDVAPQIDAFADGLLDMADNALPGIFRAVERGMPVVEGFAAFLGKTGTGLSDFFDSMSSHSPAAGAAFSSLGDIMAALLPTLGELLGQGAELAADVLPLMAGSLGLVLDVLQAIGPVLPAVVTGFLALKAVGQVTSLVDGLGVALGKLGLEKASTGVSRFAAAFGPIGLVVAGATAAYSYHNQMIEEFGNNYLAALQKVGQGGTVAEQAERQLRAMREAAENGPSTFLWFGNEHLDQLRAAEKEYAAIQAAMSPLELAQQRVASATADLEQAVGEFGATAPEAKVAADDLGFATENLKREQSELEMALDGVTSAMIDQANQALAAIDSGFAYRNSVDGLEDAQAKLAETIRNRTNADKDLRTSEEDVSRAQLAVEEQSYRTALAFGQQQADLSGLSKDSLEYKRIIQEQMLGELQRLHDAAGPQMQGAIAAQMAALRASGVTMGATGGLASQLTSQVKGLTGSIHAVPGQKYVRIDAPTAAQIQQMRDLGYTVRTLPNGSVHVSAYTASAENAINYAARTRYARVMMTVVGSSIRSTVATGGKITPDGVQRAFAPGGKVRGPGGPTDDRIPAFGPDGMPNYALSNNEWVINALRSAQQGDRRMAALNAGMADIVLRGERQVRGLAGGGPVGINPTMGTGQMAGGVTINGGVTVKVETPLNLMSDRDLTRAGEKIRDVLVRIERARA